MTGGVAGDFRLENVPDATHYSGSLSATLTGAQTSTMVNLSVDIGNAAGGTTVPVQVFIPYSPDHAELDVAADYTADTITLSEGGTVVCTGALSTFQPIDCSPDPSNPRFWNAGFVSVQLSTNP